MEREQSITSLVHAHKEDRMIIHTVFPWELKPTNKQTNTLFCCRFTTMLQQFMFKSILIFLQWVCFSLWKMEISTFIKTLYSCSKSFCYFLSSFNSFLCIGDPKSEYLNHTLILKNISAPLAAGFTVQHKTQFLSIPSLCICILVCFPQGIHRISSLTFLVYILFAAFSLCLQF